MCIISDTNKRHFVISDCSMVGLVQSFPFHIHLEQNDYRKCSLKVELLQHIACGHFVSLNAGCSMWKERQVGRKEKEKKEELV